MGRYARHVLRSADDIARLESLAQSLPNGAHVRIVLKQGDIFTGVVAELPVVQVFEDASGREGINAVVRLEAPEVPVWEAYLWLDEIRTVEPIDVGEAH